MFLNCIKCYQALFTLKVKLYITTLQVFVLSAPFLVECCVRSSWVQVVRCGSTQSSGGPPVPVARCTSGTPRSLLPQSRDPTPLCNCILTRYHQPTMQCYYEPRIKACANTPLCNFSSCKCAVQRLNPGLDETNS